jgi:CPA1 family monovalent cation:H+ antiporter
LLLASAYFTVWRDFRANLRIILQLAVGAVVFTTFMVGVAAHWAMPSLPWAACFALGAVVSPPDAVSAKAVLQRVVLPQRVVVLLEGESLVNDATGLVLFRLAVVAALTGTFDAGEAAFSFAYLSVGGVAVGALSGYLLNAVLARLKDVHLTIVGSLLASWASYIGAEALGVSGVLSTVICGLILGWRQHEFLSAVARTHARAVWEVVTFVMESLVFILIGLSLRGVLQRLGENADSPGSLVWALAAVVAAVIVSRFLWIFPAVYIPRLLFPGLRRRDPIPPVAVPLIMSWAGMRGVVSLAAALALPDAMPGRDFILIATFAVILVTVLGQGITLAPLIRLLSPEKFILDSGSTASEAEARARMVQAQLAAVQRLARTPDGGIAHPRLLEQYEHRARVATRFSEAKGELIGARDAHFAVVLEAIAAGRAELLRLHRTGVIHDAVLHALEQEIDLEEMAARRHRGEREG